MRRIRLSYLSGAVRRWGAGGGGAGRAAAWHRAPSPWHGGGPAARWAQAARGWGCASPPARAPHSQDRVAAGGCRGPSPPSSNTQEKPIKTKLETSLLTPLSNSAAGHGAIALPCTSPAPSPSCNLRNSGMRAFSTSLIHSCFLVKETKSEKALQQAEMLIAFLPFP